MAGSTRGTWSSGSSGARTRSHAAPVPSGSGTCAATAGTSSTGSRDCTASRVSAGGPIRRNRLWYFLAYDAAVERQHVGIPGSEEALDHGVTHKFAAKLSWRASPGTSVVLTAIGDPATRHIVGNPFWAPILPPDSLANPDPFLGVWNEGGVMVALNSKHLVGQRLLFEAMVSRTTSWQENGPATSRGRTDPLFSDDVTHTWSGGYGNRWDRTSTRSAASLGGEVLAGAHSLKGGVQYEDNLLHEDWRWRSNGPDSRRSSRRRTCCSRPTTAPTSPVRCCR